MKEIPLIYENSYRGKSFEPAFVREVRQHFPDFNGRCFAPVPGDFTALVKQELAREKTDFCLIRVPALFPLAAEAQAGRIAQIDSFLPHDIRPLLHQVSIEQCSYQGRLYALPRNVACGLLFFQRRILTGQGFNPPLTWSDIITQCAEIRKTHPEIQGYSFRQKSELGKIFLEHLWSTGGALTNDESEVLVAEGPAQRSLDFIRELLYIRKSAPEYYLTREAWKGKIDFLDRKLLFLQYISDLLMELKPPSGKSRAIDFSLLPVGAGCLAPSTFPEGSLYIIPANTRFPETARLLMNYFGDPERCSEFENVWFQPFSRFNSAARKTLTRPWYEEQGLRLLESCRWPLCDIRILAAAYPVISASIERGLLKTGSADESISALADELSIILEGQRFSPAVTKALSVMRKKFQTRLTLPEIAAASGLSEKYFSTVFHREAGHSVTRHLQNLRIQRAKRLLRGHPTMKLDDIAAKSGFADVKYFMRVFVKTTGGKPTEYRRRFS